MGFLQIKAKIDSTLLKADATRRDIEVLCREALEQGFAAVCVNPDRLPLAVKLLDGSGVASCTVAAFPLGALPAAEKEYEVRNALGLGAAEVDMVVNIGAVKDSDYVAVADEIRRAATAVRSERAILKVIVETALLSQDELVRVCRLAREEGAHFVKTSTGFSTRGATVEDIKFIRACVGSDMRIKASGGIRSIQQASELVTAGADRLGISNAGNLFLLKEAN